MTADFIIRKATTSDRLDIEILMSTYFLDIGDALIDNFVVADIEGKVIGAACMESGKIREIHSIAVHPNYRGKGIGSSLLDAIISELDEGAFIYARTTSPLFFEKTGFLKLEDSKKKELWKDCAECNSFNNCKQSVLRMEISNNSR